jgi:hypothetical protein
VASVWRYSVIPTVSTTRSVGAAKHINTRTCDEMNMKNGSISRRISLRAAAESANKIVEKKKAAESAESRCGQRTAPAIVSAPAQGPLALAAASFCLALVHVRATLTTRDGHHGGSPSFAARCFDELPAGASLNRRIGTIATRALCHTPPLG